MNSCGARFSVQLWALAHSRRARAEARTGTLKRAPHSFRQRAESKSVCGAGPPACAGPPGPAGRADSRVVAYGSRPAGAPAAGEGARPTSARCSKTGKLYGIALKRAPHRAIVSLVLAVSALAATPAAITIDYPQEGSIFPPDIAAPTFLWRDADPNASEWRIEVKFSDGSKALRVKAAGDFMRVGEIDPRCISETNKPPALTPEQAAAHTWKPDNATWAAIKRRSVERGATVTITGLAKNKPVSRGQVSFATSKDRVAAPIFYRDVPLMPSETEKGIIKPLAAGSLPLIAWRLRDIAAEKSKVLLTGMHTCANCHSFSADGTTMGMDVDGPQNDKGLYALVAVKSRVSIANSDIVSWNRSGTRQFGQNRVGFMSQVSPDGRYAVTTVSGTERPTTSNFYVVNFKDYRFLQVFYPTGGILAVYDRKTGVEKPLPGADDPRCVQTDGVWSPDGRYLIFARAEARPSYQAGGKLAEYANDPAETQIQYDLYRIPFNDGRGGQAEPIAGASANGMSNTFPKVSPDGRWIVFVQCRNGQLMRPDSQLFILPAAGGEARRMRCNTPLMNSWHSFSPNGRWLVFSSKMRSPYTQMYLTHINENGNDSPPILVENSTAANRAVNIPEFVNIPPDGLEQIEVPAGDYYRQFDVAAELAKKGQYEAAIPEWKKALDLNSGEARAYVGLGVALARTGKEEEAAASFRNAQQAEPDKWESYAELGVLLARQGRFDDAVLNLARATQLNPYDSGVARNLCGALAMSNGRTDDAISYCATALRTMPDDAPTQANLAVALFNAHRTDEAISHLEKASELAPENGVIHSNLAAALAGGGRFAEAIPHLRQAIDLALKAGNQQLAENLRAALAQCESRTSTNPAR